MRIAKKQILALGFGLIMVFSSAAVAQTTSASAAAPVSPAATPATGTSPAATKMGVVHIQDAILATEEGKKEFDALQQRFSPKQTQLKNLNDEVESLKKQYQTQADKLSDEEKSTRAKAIDSKQKALQRDYEDAQGEFQQAEQEVMNRLGAKMLKTLEKYAQANGYAIIMDVSNPQTSPVLWATQGNVITKELVDAYNADNPVAGAAPKAAGAAPAAKAPARPPASGTTPKKP
jgi:Skp family chaperone for outer membrane proteins